VDKSFRSRQDPLPGTPLSKTLNQRWAKASDHTFIFSAKRTSSGNNSIPGLSSKNKIYIYMEKPTNKTQPFFREAGLAENLWAELLQA
jgi:hypothetical protein